MLFSSGRRIGFGSMQLTGPGHWAAPEDPEQPIQVLRDAVDAGVTHIDTADAYGPFTAEKYIRKALHPYPEGLVIATKGGMTRQGPNQWSPCGQPNRSARQPTLVHIYTASRTRPGVLTSTVMSFHLRRWQRCHRGDQAAASGGR